MIDFHTHLFSRSFFVALAKLSPLERSVDEKLESLSSKCKIDLPPVDSEAHLKLWIDQLDENGVDHVVSFASLPEEIDEVVKVCAASKGRMFPFTVFNPTQPDAASKAETLIDKKGIRGFVLFPAMHHYKIDSNECRDALSVMERHQTPVIVHCGVLEIKLRDVIGIPRQTDLAYANPLSLVPAANAFSGIPFIVPHFGSGLFRELLMAASLCSNLYVDTSSSNSWLRFTPELAGLKDVMVRCLDVFGHERILFGTDSSVFPRGWRRDLHDRQTEIFEELDIAQDERDQIFSGNAKRLLQI